MAFKSRRGATARREAARPQASAHVGDDDDAGVVVRKERVVRRARPARPNGQDDQEQPSAPPASTNGLYSNGGLDQLRKEQTRITNTYHFGTDDPEIDNSAGRATVQIPNEDSIAAAKRKRQQLREMASSPAYIPIQKDSSSPVTVAGGIYGPGSGESALVREDDDDEVPDLLESLPNVSHTTVVDLMEEDDANPVESPVSGATMTISEAEIHMALVTRLEECRAENAALSRESAQISERLEAVRLEHDSLSNQIKEAEGKYIGLQELHSVISSLLECVSGKAPIIDQLWNEYCDLRQRLCRELAKSSHQDRGNRTLPSIKDANGEGNRSEIKEATAFGDSDADRELFQLMMEIRGQARGVFADVIDQFSTVDSVLEIFTKWRNSFPEEYESAYCDLSLPRLLAPYIKLILINSGLQDASQGAPLLATCNSIRAYSPAVMDALNSALIRPFLTTSEKS